MELYHIKFENDKIVYDRRSAYYRFNEFLIKKINNGIYNDIDLAALGENIYQNFSLVLDSNVFDSTDQVVILLTIEDDNIHQIPFELICSQRLGFIVKAGGEDYEVLDKENHFLLKRNVSIVRKSNTSKKLRIQRFPIRVLVIISMPLELYANFPLNPLMEIQAINQTFEKLGLGNKLILDIELEATLQNLKNRLNRNNYDIVHYIGHGTSNGELVLEDDKDYKRGLKVPMNELDFIFTNQEVKLVYLNACYTAQSLSTESAISNLLKTVDINPVVIAHLGTLSDFNAIQNIELIYEAFLTGRELKDIAVKARKKEGNSDWWKIVVYGMPEHTLVDHVLNSPKRSSEFQHKEPIQGNIIYRYDYVRQFFHLVKNKQSCFIWGRKGVGKTQLSLYLKNFFSREFEKSIYIDLGTEKVYSPDSLSQIINNEIPNTDYSTSLGQKNRTLLIIDHINGVIIDFLGNVNIEWSSILNTFLQREDFFTIFISHLTPSFYSQIEENSLKVEGFNVFELQSFFTFHNEKIHPLVKTNIGSIAKEFNYSPLFVVHLLEGIQPDNTIKINFNFLTRKYNFYISYFQVFSLEAFTLFYFKYPFSLNYASNVVGINAITFLLKALLLDFGETGFSIPKEIVVIFSKYIKPSKESLDIMKRRSLNFFYNFKDEVSKYDSLNILILLLNSYVLNQKVEEEELWGVLETLNEKYVEDKAFIEEYSNIVDSFKPYIDLSGLNTFITGLSNKGVNYISGFNWDAWSAMNRGDFDEALNINLRAVELDKKILKNPEWKVGTATRYSNIGLSYLNLGKLDEGMQYINKAIELDRRRGEEKNIMLAISLNIQGLIFQQKNKLENAKRSFEEAKKIHETCDFLNNDYYVVLANLGGVLIQSGEENKAVQLLITVTENSEKLYSHYKESYFFAHSQLGMIFKKKSVYEKAIFHLEKAIQVEESINIPIASKGWSSQLAAILGETYEKQGLFQKALNLYDSYIHIKDDLTKLLIWARKINCKIKLRDFSDELYTLIANFLDLYNFLISQPEYIIQVPMSIQQYFKESKTFSEKEDINIIFSNIKYELLKRQKITFEYLFSSSIN